MTTTMIRWLAAALAGSFMIPSSYPVHAAGWIVQENEQDPFDKTRSTFIALSKSEANMEWLAIRCLDGDISLLVAAGASNASHGEQSELRSSPTVCQSAMRRLSFSPPQTPRRTFNSATSLPLST